nr:MAG TPA: type I neck protein [Caudoviricetes sp.]
MDYKSFNRREMQRLQDYVERVNTSLPKFLEEFLLKEGRKAMQKAMQRTPVITGRLKRSWRLSKVEKSGDTLKVYLENDAREGSGSESYATYVEYGTRTSIGRFMATVSIKEIEEKMPNDFESAFNQFLKENDI